ncbi:Formimidoyltetrahydrofolate cyclodeaminase [Thermosyntropha lipolytica DSM 11003]|uniref:Formimidoyltetrahydrofolate cyclodeaminase n=1 Tax=Thermosyntropha lipolytica DSM 11003 TaxID=1123382 RepID=A0A1M5SG73_9FIRM|nr:cyclodeaminase/cyclohydrolase family protein [Thermosyntropha lipolytica]SHH36893.1 Formimidoyltetrahydrofolate cyclodeaminase [Thermosyntropha lipolytica DSM 11003]
MLVEMKVKEFIAELASDSPAPGGGSVSAVSGALAAGLVAMVCRLTIGKKGYEEVQSEMEQALAKAEALHQKLTQLVDDDTNAFNEVMAAFKMPKETEEEKEKRKAAIQEAYKKAADVPYTIAKTCLEVLTLAEGIVNKVNTNAISDIGVASLAAHTGLEGAVMNVKINLPSIKDETYVNNRKREIEEFLKQGGASRDKIYEAVCKMLEG